MYGMSNGELLGNLRTATIAVVPERPRKIIFLFTGQGASSRGWVQCCIEHSPPFAMPSIDASRRCFRGASQACYPTFWDTRR